MNPDRFEVHEYPRYLEKFVYPDRDEGDEGMVIPGEDFERLCQRAIRTLKRYNRALGLEPLFPGSWELAIYAMAEAESEFDREDRRRGFEPLIDDKDGYVAPLELSSLTVNLREMHMDSIIKQYFRLKFHPVFLVE